MHSSYLRLNEINIRAARHFRHHFSFVSDEKWLFDDHHFVANFMSGNVRNKVYYSSRGAFNFSVKFYDAGAMSENLRSDILSKFKNCDIIVVTEISDLNNHIYFIKIKDGTNMKTLQCMDGNIEVTENYIYGGQ